MLTIKKLNKTYGKRKIKVYDGKEFFGTIEEFFHWISILNVHNDEESHAKLRKIAMENLWWLLHSDHINEDYTEEEAWKEKCDHWNKGRGSELSYEVDSLFFPGEYEIALNSINNK